MKILVNNTAASTGGAISILKNLYEYIINSNDEKENEWIFLLNDNYIEEKENVKVIVVDQGKKSWFKRLCFDLIKGKSYISKFKPDIVFSLQNTITFGLKIPQVLYMHQAIPFQKEKRFSFLKAEERTLAVYQYIIGRLIAKSIEKADHTIVQTEWIKKEVIRKCNISPSKISVITPTVSNISKLDSNSKVLKYEKSSFFYPAADSIYKNHDCIYKACKILNEKGINDFNVNLTINGFEPIANISFLGKQNFDSVIKHYQTSALIFPSYIETLGLPLVEAKKMNTIILASNTSFSREILKNYKNAYFFNPFKPEELANLMSNIIEGSIVKQKISNENSVTYNSWQNLCEIIKSKA